uniref:Transposase n=1 Tax=Clostridium botulinum TaxID=1491 RepID=R4NNW9_CLOBO|nr:transposase [Clostridium botulinum]AGL45050.1 transposase [Clostridium botulinum]AGL45090.1 transposase [Clostridium botulinum]AGL45130.1 transposase [Clostridium botulinum]AGL45170.1 transposase [Clostridium botulinum]
MILFQKTKSSSKAKNIIEKCLFHNSHLKEKTVYEYQILVSRFSALFNSYLR